MARVRLTIESKYFPFLTSEEIEYLGDRLRDKYFYQSKRDICTVGMLTEILKGRTAEEFIADLDNRMNTFNAKYSCDKGLAVRVDGDRLFIKFAYNEQLKNELKKELGAKWHPDSREWSVSLENETEANEIVKKHLNKSFLKEEKENNMKTIKVTFNKNGKEYNFNTLDDSGKVGDLCLVYSLDRYSVVEVIDVLDNFEECRTGIVGKISDMPTILREDADFEGADFFLYNVYKAKNKYICKDKFRDWENLARLLSFMLNNLNNYFYIGINESNKRYFAGIFTERKTEKDVEIKVTLDTCYFISVDKFDSTEQKQFAAENFVIDPRTVDYNDGNSSDVLAIQSFIKDNNINEDYLNESSDSHIIAETMDLLKENLNIESLCFLPVDGNSCEYDLAEYYDGETESYSFDLLNRNIETINNLYNYSDTEYIFFKWQEGFIQKEVQANKDSMPEIIRKYVSTEHVNLSSVKALKLIQDNGAVDGDYYDDSDLHSIMSAHSEILILEQ